MIKYLYKIKDEKRVNIMVNNIKLLDLEQDNIIKIEKNEYKVLSRIKFVEKASYWFEYKLQNIENLQEYYLNVEILSKAILYKRLDIEQIQLKMNIIFENEEYELLEKGTGRVETYFGATDIALNEEVQYYEYKCKTDKQKVLSIEKWGDETEISIGKIISFTQISM